MAISEKILDVLNSVVKDENKKELVLNILEIEDNHVYQYTSPYENCIKSYLNKNEKDN